MIDELKTDYKDDVLATSQQGKRTFNIVGKNGEILFEDVHIEDTSRYLQVGDEYGQEIINEQNSAINQLSKGTGYVFDTYAEYLEAYQGGEIPVGAIVYIKEGSVDGTITALQVKYNDSNVKLALDTLGNNLGSKSSASEVTGNDAFSKIAELNMSKLNKADMYWTEESLPTVTVPNNTFTKIGEITLTKGLYIVRITANWLVNSAGGRFIGFYPRFERNSSDSIQAATGLQTIHSLVKFFNVIDESKTFPFYANQTSGNNMSCYPYYEYIKLK